MDCSRVFIYDFKNEFDCLCMVAKHEKLWFIAFSIGLVPYVINHINQTEGFFLKWLLERKRINIVRAAWGCCVTQYVQNIGLTVLLLGVISTICMTHTGSDFACCLSIHDVNEITV
jgi:hypothetical protein